MNNIATSEEPSVLDYLLAHYPDAAQVILLTWTSPAWPGPGPAPHGIQPGERPLRAPEEWPRPRRRRAVAVIVAAKLVLTRELRGIGLAIRAANLNLEAEFARESACADHPNTTPQPGHGHLTSTPKPRQAGSPTHAQFLISGSLTESREDRSGPERREEREARDLDVLAQAVRAALAPRYSLDLAAVEKRVQDWAGEGYCPNEILKQAFGLARDMHFEANKPLRALGKRLAMRFVVQDEPSALADERPGLTATEQYCQDLREAQHATERDRPKIEKRLAEFRVRRAGVGQ